MATIDQQRAMAMAAARLRIQSQGPDQIEQSAIDAMRPTRLERLGRGFADIGQGITQTALRAKDFVTGSQDAPAYDAAKTAELRMYEQGRGNDAGIDWMRLAGNVVATLPAAMIPPLGAPAKLATSVITGAAQGGIAGASMFTPEGESKVAQALIGLGFGAAVPVAINGIKNAIVSLVGNRSVAPANPMQLKGDLTIELKKHGIDFGRLSGEVQKSLMDDAQRAITVGGKLKPDALARKATIETVGAKPTLASITRNPADWTQQQNMRGIVGVGEPIVRRQAENAEAMTTYLAKLRSAVGGKATTPYEAGESAIAAIKAHDAAREKAVSGLYDAYRATNGAATALPDVRIAETLGRVADDIGIENIPTPVLNRLKEFGFLSGERAKLLTINEADKLNRLINNNNPGFGPQSKALAMLKESLNDALMSVPDNGTSKALTMARTAAAHRFAEQRASQGIGAAIEDVAPDQFVSKFILRPDARELRATLIELSKSSPGKQAVADIKGTIFDTLLMKATGASNIDDVLGQPFSGVRFAKALDAIPKEKQILLFSPSEMASLNTLKKASEYLTKEVPFSDVNYSKTSQALANILLKIGNTPMLGKLVAPIIGTGKIGMDWVKDAAQRKVVADALLGSAVVKGARPPVPVSPFEGLIPGAVGAVTNQPSQ